MQCDVHFTSEVLIASGSVQHKIMLETIQWSDVGAKRQFYLKDSIQFMFKPPTPLYIP